MSLLEYWNVDADDNSDALTAGLIDAIGDGVNALLDPKSTDRDATSNRERVASAIKATDSRIWELAEALRRTRQDRDDFENAVGAEQQRVADLEQDVATVTARAIAAESSLAEVSKQYVDMKAHAEALAIDITSTRARLDEQNDRVDELERQLEERTNERDRNWHTVVQQNDEIEAVRYQLAQMRQRAQAADERADRASRGR
jgi:chromosome segregation ATPase